MLRDEVVPVGDPHGAVRSDLSVHRGDPLLGSRHQVPAVSRHDAGALVLDDSLPH